MHIEKTQLLLRFWYTLTITLLGLWVKGLYYLLIDYRFNSSSVKWFSELFWSWPVVFVQLGTHMLWQTNKSLWKRIRRGLVLNNESHNIIHQLPDAYLKQDSSVIRHVLLIVVLFLYLYIFMEKGKQNVLNI